MYEIEHNVPIPSKTYRGSTGRQTAISRNIPWNDMRVGDSVFIPLAGLPPGTGSGQVAYVIDAHVRVHRGEQYLYRSACKDGAEGWRIWLVRRKGLVWQIP